jgi:transcriptional antiterminator RfaH
MNHSSVAEWYVVQTSIHKEAAAQGMLESRGVTCWMPVIAPTSGYAQRKQASSRRKGAEYTGSPLFPRYLFARFNPDVIHTTVVKNTPWVSGLVSFGERLVTISDAEMDKIKHSAAATLASLSQPIPPQTGDEVELVSGSFEYMQGIFREPDGDKRSMIMIELLGRQVIRSIPNKDFRLTERNHE